MLDHATTLADLHALGGMLDLVAASDDDPRRPLWHRARAKLSYLVVFHANPSFCPFDSTNCKSLCEHIAALCERLADESPTAACRDLWISQRHALLGLADWHAAQAPLTPDNPAPLRSLPSLPSFLN